MQKDAIVYGVSCANNSAFFQRVLPMWLGFEYPPGHAIERTFVRDAINSVLQRIVRNKGKHDAGQQADE